MRARPLFLVALAVTLAGLAAYVVVPPALGRQHRAAIAEAQRLATALPDPAGATPTPPRECNGGILRCVHVARDPDAVAAEMAAGLAGVAGRAPATSCEEHVVPGPKPFPARSCQVRLTTGRGHAVLVMVDTRVRRVGKTREVRPSGTEVWVVTV